MIKCEYCERESRSQSGMSQHLRGAHPDQWKGSVKASFSEGYDMGQHEPGAYHKPTKEEYERSVATRKAKKKAVPAVVGKGQKKPPIHQNCPWCNFRSIHPPSLAWHIRGKHPKKWKGRLSITLGKPLTTSDKYLAKKAKIKAGLNKSNSRLANRLEEINREGNQQDARYYINCCPNCGTSLVPYYLAAGIANRKRE